MTVNDNIDDLDFSGSTGAEVAAEKSKSGNFEREVQFLSLDGSPAGKARGADSILLRFLTNMTGAPEGVKATKFNLGWITVLGHYAPTKEKPPYAREGAQWPSKMGAGCRHDKVFKARFGDQCHICDVIGSKPSNRTWALAVERQEHRDSNGQIEGYSDKTREIFDTDEKGDLIVLGEEGGKKKYQMKEVPAYIVMSMGWRNFFQPLQGQAQYFNSLLDSDWLITRSGTVADDTSYAHVRVAQQDIPADNPYGLEAQKYDLGAPGVMEAVYPDMPDLRRILLDRVSDEYFGRFFVPGWLPEGFDPNQAKDTGQKKSGGKGGMMMSSSPSQGAPKTPDTPQSAPASEPTSEALSALQQRITGGSGS